MKDEKAEKAIQEKIATALGVHQQTVIAWFDGKYEPSPLAKDKLEQFLFMRI